MWFKTVLCCASEGTKKSKRNCSEYYLQFNFFCRDDLFNENLLIYKNKIIKQFMRRY